MNSLNLQPLAATKATSSGLSLKPNRDTGRGKEGNLADRLSGRRRLAVVEHVQEHVLLVVRVHDAQVRCDRRGSEPELSRHVEVEALGRGQARAIPCAAQELILRSTTTLSEGVGARIVHATHDLADDVGV